MVPTLSKLPNRLILPDLLGYGGTDKPTDPAAYAYHLMVRDIVDILDAEGIDKVVSLGHDHGVGTATRFYNHHPDRTAAVITMNVAYRPINKEQPFDLDAVNAMGKKAFGYTPFDYWYLFTAPDGPKILNENVDRLWDVAHANKFEDMRDIMCAPGGLRRYATDRSIPSIEIRAYSKDEKLKEEWIGRLKENRFEAPVCWYLALTQNHQFESDKKIKDDNIKVNVPMLYIGCDQDAVCRPELIKPPQEAGLLPDLTVEILEGVAHWPMYERPEETCRIIMDFVHNKGL